MKDSTLKGIHGHILKSSQVADFTLTETIYDVESKIGKHFHEQAQFCLLLEGSYTEICENKIIDCNPFSLKFLTAGESHIDHLKSSTARCFVIELAPQLIERVKEHAVLLDRPANFQNGLSLHLSWKINREFHQTDKVSSLIIEGLTLELLAEASRKTIKDHDNQIPVWLKHAKEILHEHFTESLSLTEIAAQVSVHPVHLAREFRKHYKKTIGEYKRQLQIEFACLKLSSTESPLSEIALASGFFDQSHFTRTFKRYNKITPAEYRAAFRSR